ncbi:macro domain-containing protein [Lysinibacillus sphaericus]|uniref:macro domain-containing protein n=1 Tax=Lysinibacillus sphaericus TaxID=1421 RepID=UPI000C19B9FB|nr:macro domain-containing protein [Lysinibacillus sphaericus]PIJ96863.1 hypothetical protein CTN02_15740 [Lysinibacillus sphaericus]
MKQWFLKFFELIKDIGVWQKAWLIPGIFFAVTTALLSFFDPKYEVFGYEFKHFLFGILVIFTFIYMIVYISIFAGKDSIKLDIDGSIFEVVTGDIFMQSCNEIKVIAFNEYFDTVVDNDLISESSLNGKYLNKKYGTIEEIQDLDKRIIENKKLSKNVKEYNAIREFGGKTIRYELGSVFRDEDYFLLAFSKFNRRNEANLSLTEYTMCLLKFWNEVNTYHNQKIVNLPLLGTGIIRHRDFNATNQELLEVLIWTFKISKVKFREPAKIRIIIRKEDKDKINFYKLKELEKNGI